MTSLSDFDHELARTDPELVGYVDDFAFGEVPQHGSLDPRTRLLVHAAALIACQAPTAYRAVAVAALRQSVTPVQLKEVVYQAVPYLGLAKVIDFVRVTNELLADRGVALPLDPQSTTTPADRAERGLAVQKQIVGDEAVDAMYANAPSDLQHVQRWLSANCFGDHYTRTGLDLPLRELITLVLLVSHGGCDPQARGHVKGNLNVGNDRGYLIEVVSQLLPYIGYPRTVNAIAAINEVAPPS